MTSIPPRTAAPHQEATRDVQGLPAGFATRTAANAIDLLVTATVLAATYLLIAALRFAWNPRTFRFPAPSLALVISVASAIAIAYFAVAWLTTGRTYGDYVLGLRVTTRKGTRLGGGRAALRAVACVVFPLGLLWVVASNGSLSLQDLLVRTVVVYDWSEE